MKQNLLHKFRREKRERLLSQKAQSYMFDRVLNIVGPYDSL